MNACSQAPLTDRTHAAAQAFLDSWNTAGMDWDAWIAEVDRARAVFARLIGAEPNHVAVCASVSHAVSAVASALDFSGSRRTVVVTEAEFPTVGHVWLAQQKRGAAIEWVPVRDGTVLEADLDAAIGESTLIVSACHGYYQNGFTQDVRAVAGMAHERGALIFVDAYQTLGTRPVDVRALGVDFLASGALKFLMGTAGIAFLYVRPDLIEQLHPSVTGWFGRNDPFAFDVRQLDWPNAGSRFDTGTPPVLTAYIARAGMAIIEEVGVSRIHAWTSALTRRLIEEGEARGLRVHGTRDVARKTPTTAFVVGGDSHEIERRLRERGVIASARGPTIRLAPHFYSTLEDVDESVRALSAVSRSP